MKRISIGVLALLGLGIYAGTDRVDEFDPALETVAYEIRFQGRPLTGIIYGFHGNHEWKRLTWVWAGRKVGTERIWYDNGAIMAERPHNGAGQPHGAWKQWYADGRVKSHKFYRDGVIDGEMWGWHANGQVSDYNRYDHGTELTHKSWVSDGTPFYNYVYQNGRRVGMRGGEFCKRLDKIQ